MSADSTTKVPFQYTPNGNAYHTDKPPSMEWAENDTRLWYKEPPRMTLHFYRKDNPNWSQDRGVSVFVNMDFQPVGEDILAFIARGLLAGGVQYETVTNLRLVNWNGRGNAFWYADLIGVIP